MVVQRTLGGGGGYFGAGLILREGGRREFYISILVGYDNKTVSITEIWRELYWGGGGGGGGDFIQSAYIWNIYTSSDCYLYRVRGSIM